MARTAKGRMYNERLWGITKEGLEIESEIETGLGKVDGGGSARRVRERQI